MKNHTNTALKLLITLLALGLFGVTAVQAEGTVNVILMFVSFFLTAGLIIGVTVNETEDTAREATSS